MNYQIAKPCTQNWNEMQASANGRFCTHCQKEVYDLTTGKTLPNTNGNFCGRIKVDAPTKEISFKKLVWKQNPIKYFFLTSLLLFTRNIKAQIADKNAKDNNSSNQNREDTITKTITITGTIADKNTKEGIPFANIVIYDKQSNQLATVTTDIDGKYKVRIYKANIKSKSLNIKVLYVGYLPAIIKDIPITSSKKDITLNTDLTINKTINLEQITMGLMETVITDKDTTIKTKKHKK